MRKPKKSINIQDVNHTNSKKRKKDSHRASSRSTSDPFQQNDKDPDPSQQYDEDPNPFYQNEEENIHTLFSSSSKPSRFHIPAPMTDKNNDVDDEYNIDQGEGYGDEDEGEDSVKMII